MLQEHYNASGIWSACKLAMAWRRVKITHPPISEFWAVSLSLLSIDMDTSFSVFTHACNISLRSPFSFAHVGHHTSRIAKDARRTTNHWLLHHMGPAPCAHYSHGRTDRRSVLILINAHLTILMIITHLTIRLSNAHLTPPLSNALLTVRRSNACLTIFLIIIV